jgi:hypothetical protein
MGVSGQRHAPAALYVGKEPPAPIGYKAGWTSELVWTQRLGEKVLCLCRRSNPVWQVVEYAMYSGTEMYSVT